MEVWKGLEKVSKCESVISLKNNSDLREISSHSFSKMHLFIDIQTFALSWVSYLCFSVLGSKSI